MIVLVRLLVLSAVVAAVVGFTTLTDATFGVGAIGIACLLAILARIAQAHGQPAATHSARVEAAVHGAGAVWPVENAAPRSGDIAGRNIARAWAIVAAVVLFTAWVIYSTLRDPSTFAARAGPATVSQPLTPSGSVRVARTATGWEVANTTQLGWFDCVAEAGASTARIGDVGPYGLVVLNRDDFVPPLPAGSSDGLEIMCQRDRRD